MRAEIAGRLAAIPRFHWAYFCAHLGLFFGYIPFFGLLLPVRVAEISKDALYDQSAIVLIGSVTASVAGVFSGRLCDAWNRRTGQRRPIIWAGLTVIMASYAVFAYSLSVAALMAAIIVLQIGINLTLAGLGAMFALHTAAGDKARLASVVNLCLPIANLGILLGASGDGVGASGGQLAALCAVMAALFLPMMAWRGAGTPLITARAARAAHRVYAAIPDTASYLGVFGARLLVQFSGALLLTFAQPYLLSRFPEYSAGRVQDVFVLMVVAAAILAVPVALTATWAAAARVNPLTINMASAALLAAAMAVLAVAVSPVLIIIGYAVFMSAMVSYLAIDTAVIAQWLAASPALATRLGLMNLANTLPGIALPAMILAFGEGASAALPLLFAMTAAGAGIAAITLGWARARVGT